MIYYQFQSVINEAHLKEVKWTVIPKSKKAGVYAFIIFLLCISVISTIFKNYIIASALVIVAIALIVEIFKILKKNVEAAMKRMQEKAQTELYILTATFTDLAIEVENHTANIQGKIIYKDIVRFEDTEHYYLLFSKTKQYVSIDRNTIDQTGQTEQFMKFLDNKCVNLHL